MTDEIWDGVLEPFAEHPAAAFVFAQSLLMLKKKIGSGPEGTLFVTRALERGIEKLYPYTTSHQAAYKLYLLAVEGTLLPKHDPTTIIGELS
jgi:hypothetical protein